MGQIAAKTGEWSGIPLPLDGARLVIEPTYPWAEHLSKIGVQEEPEAEKLAGWKVRNLWYCTRRRADIAILQDPEGKITWGWKEAFHHLDNDLRTLGASDVWGIEQESKALDLLSTMVRHRAFRQYLLTGMFLERSRRSGVTYLFRRLKPTVAISSGTDGQLRILACLCQHPIAYYEDSWAGAMCPTDDVVAHLVMMRGDEHMFWKRCNHHPPYRPEAGL